jgi:hypothetical protein
MNWRRFGVNLGKPIYNLEGFVLYVPKLVKQGGKEVKRWAFIRLSKSWRG